MVAIFVLAAFLLFIAVDLIVLKVQGKYHPAFEPVYHPIDLLLFDRNSFIIPSNLYFSKGHTWLQKTKEGLFNIGIDAFANSALGKLSIIKCAAEGESLHRGDLLFEGTYGNCNVKFLSPVSGKVKFVNTNIIGKTISDPYKQWGVQILPKDFSENFKDFFSGQKASIWMNNELSKLKNFLDNHLFETAAVGATMYDGGSLSKDAFTALSNKSIADFEKEFLSL